MNYKKIIKSRALRLKLLSLLGWIPDKEMLKIQYRVKFGRKLNLENPHRFTEKIQWYKLYYREPQMIQCVDKYDVRQFVNKLGLGSILLRNYGVYSSFEEINFESLPNKFVIKDTLGSGGNSVFICEDKLKLNQSALEEKVNAWLNVTLHKNGGREWPYYSGKKNRIITEELIECDDPHGLVDYKFVCFNGKVAILYVMCDRVVGQEVKLGIYNRNLERLAVSELTEKVIDFDFIFPDNMYEMIEIAEKLAKPFPQVRVDLYNNNGKILFGELSFFDESGYMIYDPDSFDFTLGEQFLLPKKKNEL